MMKINKYKSKSKIQRSENIIQVVEPISEENIARQLVSFSVTTDSVVATAHIVVEPTHKGLTIYWGDDQIEIINLKKLRVLSSSGSGSPEALNTLKIQHKYSAPFDYGRKIIIVESKDISGKKSFDTAVIEIEQRYLLLSYSIILEFPNHLDSIFESTSEIEARMHVAHNGIVFHSRAWKDDVITKPDITTGRPIQWRLNESNFTREIAYSDSPVEIFFDMTEHDGIFPDDSIADDIWDVLVSPIRLLGTFPLSTNSAYHDAFDLPDATGIPFAIHPRFSLNKNTATAVWRLPLDRGIIYIKFNYSLRLIIPLDKQLDLKMVIA